MALAFWQRAEKNLKTVADRSQNCHNSAGPLGVHSLGRIDHDKFWTAVSISGVLCRAGGSDGSGKYEFCAVCGYLHYRGQGNRSLGRSHPTRRGYRDQHGDGRKPNASTDSTGTYRAALLPPGNYNITVMQEGFGTLKRSGVNVEVGVTATIDMESAGGECNVGRDGYRRSAPYKS